MSFGGPRGICEPSDSSLALGDTLDGGEGPIPEDKGGGVGIPTRLRAVVALEGADESRSRVIVDATRDAGRESGAGVGPVPIVIVRASETEMVASVAISAARSGERGVVVKTT
jgi:hypothetical protein